MSIQTHETRSRLYFSSNQKDLLFMANSEAGRHLLGIKDKYPVIQLFPGSYHQLIDIKKDRVIIRAMFHTWNKIADIFVPILTKSEIAKVPINYKSFLHFSELQKNPKFPQIYLATDTFDSVVGGSLRRINESTWSAARGATSADDTNSTIHSSKDGANYHVGRTFIQYNTASIPDDATDVSGQVVYPAAGNVIDSDNQNWEITEHTIADNTAPVLADFDLFLDTVFQSTDAGSFSTGGTTTVDLNSAGNSNINLTGYTKHVTRGSKDVSNTTPGNVNRIAFNPTLYDLKVTYTPLVTGLPSPRMLIGVGT